MLFFLMAALMVWQYVGAPQTGFTQGYPSKEIHIVVPFTTGGGNDVLARAIGKELSDRWGQPVIVDNRPGGGGTIGAGIAAKAAPDGYTMLFVSTSFGMQPSLNRKLSYDPIKNFTAVAWVASGQFVLAVHPSVGVQSVKELIALAKANPGKLNYASTGIGGAAHLRGELFKSVTGADFVHIPYKGTSPVQVDLLAGRVSFSFMDLFPLLPHVEAGKVVILAVSGTARSPKLPDVPTMAEEGIPGFEAGQWFGLVAPAGTPKDITAKLNEEIVKIVQLPEIKARLNKLGLDTMGSTPEEFNAHIESEVKKWIKVVKNAGISIEK